MILLEVSFSDEESYKAFFHDGLIKRIAAPARHKNGRITALYRVDEECLVSVLRDCIDIPSDAFVSVK